MFWAFFLSLPSLLALGGMGRAVYVRLRCVCRTRAERLTAWSVWAAQPGEIAGHVARVINTTIAPPFDARHTHVTGK